MLRRSVALGLLLASCARPTPDAPPPAGSSASVLPPPPPSAMPSAPPPAPPPASSSADASAPLDALAALEAAKAAGLRATMIVPHPVRCPAIPAASGDVSKLRATGALAPFVVDPDAFLGEGLGAPEAVALLGSPALCNQEAGSAFSELHLAPRDPGVASATLETKDGEVIGVVVRLEGEAVIDLDALSKRFGKRRTLPGLHGPSSDAFDVDTPAFRGMLVFQKKERGDPTTATRVREIIFRRTPRLEILPDRFTRADDVVRLARLALRPRAPDAVSFFGTLGVVDQKTGAVVSFLPAKDLRNVATASLGVRAAGKRDLVQTLRASFASPLAGTAADVAKGLGATASERRGASTVLTVPGGVVVVDEGPAGIAAVHVERR